ncbi:MAG TPA: hypothetical protein VJ944_04035, partial [Thermoplasmataceae archaeon]|nr:hypothetical protein [Thermoplasmataceae archaeon]
ADRIYLVKGKQIFVGGNQQILSVTAIMPYSNPVVDVGKIAFTFPAEPITSPVPSAVNGDWSALFESGYSASDILDIPGIFMAQSEWEERKWKHSFDEMKITVAYTCTCNPYQNLFS